MEHQNGNSSDSSSFEDLTKESEMKEEEQDDSFMDILGNKQLTKKVGREVNIVKSLLKLIQSCCNFRF